MMKKHFQTVCLMIGAMLLGGCAGYGGLEAVSRSDQEMTIENLVARQGEYDVYYSGYDLGNASGILFDPKNDFKRLAPSDRWHPVYGMSAVAELVSWIQIQDSPGYYPGLHRIRGPKGEFYGYLYSGWSELVTKVQDKSTLFVYDLPDPPHYRGPSTYFEEVF